MLAEKLAKTLDAHPDVLLNPARPLMIYEAVKNKEATVSANGALNTWTPPESTGRSPNCTYIVRHEETAGLIDWDSPNCIPLDPETFDMIVEDALVPACPTRPGAQHLRRPGLHSGRCPLRQAGSGQVRWSGAKASGRPDSQCGGGHGFRPALRCDCWVSLRR
jgi:hypothetical protein